MSGDSGSDAGAADADDGAPPLQRGTYVAVGGLTSTSGQALNGKVGRIQSYNGASKRYSVLFEGATRRRRISTNTEMQSAVAIKAVNLTQRVEGVQLIHLVSKPELNSRLGDVVDYNRKTRRYSIQLVRTRFLFFLVIFLLFLRVFFLLLLLETLEDNGTVVPLWCPLLSYDRGPVKHPVSVPSRVLSYTLGGCTLLSNICADVSNFDMIPHQRHRHVWAMANHRCYRSSQTM